MVIFFFNYFLFDCIKNISLLSGLSCKTWVFVVACEISVPWPGIKPSSPALQRRFLSTGHQGRPCPQDCQTRDKRTHLSLLAEAPRYDLGWYWWPSDQAEKSFCGGGKWSHHTTWSHPRKEKEPGTPWVALTGRRAPVIQMSQTLHSILWFHHLINSPVQELVQIGFLSLIITSPNWYKEEPSNQRHLSKNNFCMKNHTTFDQRPKCKATGCKTLRGKCKAGYSLI